MGRTESYQTDRKIKADIVAMNNRIMAVLLPVMLFILFLFPCRALATTIPGRVTGLTGTSGGMSSVDLTWNAVASVNGYVIFLVQGGDNIELTRVQENKAHITVGADGNPLVTGRAYSFCVSAYVMSDTPEASASTIQPEILGEYSDAVSVTPVLATPASFAAEGKNYKTIQLTWEKVEEAQGYVILKSEKEGGPYKKFKTIKKGTTVTLKDKKCKPGILYYYKIQSYAKSTGGQVLSAESDIISSPTLLSAPKLQSAAAASADTVLLKWKKVTGAKGYIIYRSTSKKGVYAKVDTIDSPTATSAYVEGQENGVKYFYKIKAYANKKKKSTHSAFSNIKSAKFNLLASANETYMQKCKRVFSSISYRKFASAEEAAAHMTTIKINVWDFASDGVTKITKVRTLTVHEKIAPTVQQIFKEIYEGEEKFPIKNVGGYSWRGASSRSEHCEGLAIDINWEENALIQDGVVITGKYYKPGEDPYSIPTDGEVAKIMKKYGFSQGLWGNRCDYMHFSYFGT